MSLSTNPWESSGSSFPGTFPCHRRLRGFAPALAAGNTGVLKPAELTPLTAIRLGQLAREARLPEGVLQIIPARVRSLASGS
jgi:acyl-CoA reductase-like NAD-dependent aldehyde dehydrogenase